MSKETIKIVEINTDPAKKSIKDLRKELMELKNQMANLEEGGDEFLEIANKAGELKHQLDEINKVVGIAAYEFDDYAGKIGGVAAGLSGAFTAVNGALNLFGKESEAIDKAILKMQSLMAITQGLSTIPKAVKDLEDLRNAITSTTGAAKLLKAALQPKVFLAISAAVAGITAIFSRWKKQEDEVQAAIKRRREELEKIKMDKIIEDHKRYNDELQRTLTIQEGYNQGFYKGDRKGELIANINAYQQEVNRLMMTVPEGMQKKIDEYNEAISRYTEADQEYWELLVEIAHYEGEIENFNRKSETERNVLIATYEEYAKKLNSLKTELNVLKAIEQGEADLIAQREQEIGDLELHGVIVPLQVQPLPPANEGVEAIGVKIGKMIADAEIKARNRRWKEEVENIENVGNEVFEQLKSSMTMFTDSSLGLTSGWIEGLEEFQLAFQQTMAIVKDEGTVSWTAYGDVAATALGGIGTMLNALSNEQDASNEKGFEQMKNLQIAATVMNMLSGIMSAWTSAMSPANAWMTVAGQIAMGTAMSAMIAGIGGAQIAKIKSQTMTSANPNTNINAKSVSSMIVPPVQYSQAVQGASTEGAITNQKVYVTESDIVDTIGKVSVQETENTY